MSGCAFGSLALLLTGVLLAGCQSKQVATDCGLLEPCAETTGGASSAAWICHLPVLPEGAVAYDVYKTSPYDAWPIFPRTGNTLFAIEAGDGPLTTPRAPGRETGWYAGANDFGESFLRLGARVDRAMGGTTDLREPRGAAWWPDFVVADRGWPPSATSDVSLPVVASPVDHDSTLTGGLAHTASLLSPKRLWARWVDDDPFETLTRSAAVIFLVIVLLVPLGCSVIASGPAASRRRDVPEAFRRKRRPLERCPG